MRDNGVTLVELIVVIAVIGILAIALGFSYVGWQGAYKVEKETKELYTDLMDARSRATTHGRMYFVDFPTTTTYRISINDSDGAAKGDGNVCFEPQADPAVPTPGTDTTQPPFPKTVEYALASTGAGIPGAVFSCDKWGMIDENHCDGEIYMTDDDPDRTICIFTDRDGDGASDFNPDFDCITLTRTRITMGKLTSQNPGDCNAAHCTAK